LDKLYLNVLTFMFGDAAEVKLN